MRETVAIHAGRLFKHTGDGVCAVFASPKAAVDAAVAAQRKLELPVRMGIATGEAELRGDDYFGAVLNRAARVMAAGHGGQILLDGATAGLLGGVELISLGSSRLRDIAKPVDVFQVEAEGLRIEFPPLKTVDPTPGNLRPRNTTFIGRELELAELAEVVKAHQLVTLTGVGGVGKTRLALEVASELSDNFADGVWIIELAAVADPAAVPEAVAAVLGITQQHGLSVAESVAAALEGRERLLIFDNCEHVLDAAADMIDAILSHSSTVKILATSREGLRLADEQLWPVPSLDVRSGIDSASAALFVERARAVAPAFSMAEDADAVAEICRRLDGIPLAIELAASRLQSMTVSEVRDRLDNRFRLLVGSRRGLERHQTLRHAVQWSYELLDDAEKSLLRICSVFAGGFDLDSACAVSGSSDDFATLDLLDALTRKSLLVADRSSARTRFSMLETIRQFAEEQLVQTGAADDARNAHARYFAGKEADLLVLWDSPRQRAAYEWLTVEFANLRSAFRWSADTGDLETAVAIAFYAALIGSWLEKYEPATWAEELIEAATAVDHRRLAQLQFMAAECYAAGRHLDAVGYFEAGLAGVSSARYDAVPHDFDALLGGTYLWVGRPDRWAELCRDTIATKSGPHVATRACLPMALRLSGMVDEAVAACDGLLEAANSTGNPCEKAWAFMGYGLVRQDVDPNESYDVLRQALDIAQDSGNRQLESHIAAGLAELAATQGDPLDAFEFFTLAIRNYHDSGSFSHLRTPLGELSTLFNRLGRYEPASTIIGFAADSFIHATYPQIDIVISDLRKVLGDPAFESLARTGENMTNAEMAGYALAQIDLARADLLLASEPQ